MYSVRSLVIVKIDHTGTLWKRTSAGDHYSGPASVNVLSTTFSRYINGNSTLSWNPMNKERLVLATNAARAQVAALKSCMALLDGSCALHPQIPDDDPDLIETWEHSLKECLESDRHRVNGLLHAIESAGSIIEISMAQAESLLRVCSAIRLEIRARYLNKNPDAYQDTDDIITEEQNETTNQAFMMDQHLANLQDLLLYQLTDA